MVSVNDIRFLDMGLGRCGQASFGDQVTNQVGE